jgi:hypothetical protein
MNYELAKEPEGCGVSLQGWQGRVWLCENGDYGDRALNLPLTEVQLSALSPQSHSNHTAITQQYETADGSLTTGGAA